MATKLKAAAGPTALFTVLSNLSHDGDDYAVGDTVELTEAHALALGSDVVAPAKAAKAEKA